MTEETTGTGHLPADQPPKAAAPITTRVNVFLLNFLSSIRLAVILLILLAAVSIIGTILFQGESSQDNIKLFTDMVWGVYNKLGLVGPDTHTDAAHAELARWQKSAQENGLRLYRLATGIGLDQLYNTWYFNFLLGLLSLSLIVCSVRHWPHTFRFFSHPKLVLEGEGASGIPLRREIVLKAAPSAVVSAAREVLSSRRYKVTVTEAGGASHLFAQKGIIGRFGIYVVHLSVLVIFLGAIIGFRLGHKGYINIEEGQTIDTVDLRGGKGQWKLPFAVRCDDFQVTYYEGGRRPKDFKSTLAVLEGGREVQKKVIEVNDPLIQQGIFFYQSSYGETGRGGRMRLRVSSRDGSKSSEVVLPIGTEVAVPDFDLKVRVLLNTSTNRLMFYPDFDIVDGNRFVSKSNQPNNPAAYLRFTAGDGRVFDTWLLEFYPQYHSLGAADFTAAFTQYEGHQYTGLSVAYDPGTWVVWLGCGLMVLGIFTTFFIHHKRIWVKVESDGGRGSLWLAGSTNKNRSSFEEEFEKVVSRLKESLA